MDTTLEESVVVCLLLLFLTHFYIPILEPVQSSLFSATSDGQTALGQVLTLGIWSIAGTLILRRGHAVIAGWRKFSWVVALPSLALLSACWSQDAAITTRKALFLLLTTAFGVYFAQVFSMERQMRLICAAAFGAAVLSIGFAVFLPTYGIDHDVHQGAWMGVFTQKNVCAREMLFLLATLLPFKVATTASKCWRIAAILAVCVVIVGTESKTALLLMAFVCLLFLALAFLRSVSRGLLLAASAGTLAVSGIAAVFAAPALPELMAYLGRDSTMSGRTDIWREVLRAIIKHPLLGYGFAAFWLSLRGESANIILALRWAVPAAHNGFLDLWLQLGAAGLLLFLGGFAAACHSAWKGLRQPSFARATWPVAILVLTLLYNMDESSLMQPNDFLWVILIATIVNLSIVKSPYVARDVLPGAAGAQDLLSV